MLMAVGMGLGELFSHVPVIYQVMQVLGMAYMLYLAWGIVLLVVFHVAGALFHHFVIRDRTLIRMLKPVKKSDLQ